MSSCDTSKSCGRTIMCDLLQWWLLCCRGEPRLRWAWRRGGGRGPSLRAAFVLICCICDGSHTTNRHREGHSIEKGMERWRELEDDASRATIMLQAGGASTLERMFLSSCGMVACEIIPGKKWTAAHAAPNW